MRYDPVRKQGKTSDLRHWCVSEKIKLFEFANRCSINRQFLLKNKFLFCSIEAAEYSLLTNFPQLSYPALVSLCR